MVVATCGKERSVASKPVSDLKPKDVAIERDRTVQVRDLQMDVPDGRARGDCAIMG